MADLNRLLLDNLALLLEKNGDVDGALSELGKALGEFARTAVDKAIDLLGRYLATLIAIMTGVGFYTAVGVVSDGVIASLEGNVDAEYGRRLDDEGAGSPDPLDAERRRW